MNYNKINKSLIYITNTLIVLQFLLIIISILLLINKEGLFDILIKLGGIESIENDIKRVVFQIGNSDSVYFRFGLQNDISINILDSLIFFILLLYLNKRMKKRKQF